jgi:hypothetical protein
MARRTAPMAALLRVVAVRILRRPASSALVVSGVALAALAVGGSRLAATAARDVSLRNAISAADHEARSLRVAIFRASGAPEAAGFFPQRPGEGPLPVDLSEYTKQLDPRTRRQLPREGFSPAVTRAVVTSSGQEDFGGVPVRFIGLAEPARWLTLRYGHNPRRCTPSRCEAVLVGGRAPPRASFRAGHLHVRIVGRGRIDPTPVGEVPPRDFTTIGANATFLVVNGLTPVLREPAIGILPRTYYWSRELDRHAVRPWNLDDVRRATRVARAAVLGAGAQAVSGPDRLLDAQRVRGRASEARLALLVGQATAALLAFAAFAATQRRRDLVEDLDRIRDAGGTRLHLAALVALEAGLLAGIGVLLGGGVALVVAAAIAGGDVVAHDVVSVTFLALIAGCLLAGAGALGLAARVPRPAKRAFGVPDLLITAALGAGLWQALARGALNSDDLASGGGDPAVLLLPALVVAAAALLTMRILPLALRTLARTTRRRDPTIRMTVLGLARDAARSGATVAMLAAAGAAGLFALSYSKSLAVGATDEAAFEVGSDVRVIEGPPAPRADRDVLPARRYHRLAGVATSAPVIRQVAERLDTEDAGLGSLALLGMPASALGDLPGWRRDLSDASPARLGRLLGPAAGLTLSGDVLPRNAHTARIRVVLEGADVGAALAVQGRDGRVSRLPLDAIADGTPHESTVRIGRAQRGGRVVGVLVRIRLGGVHEGFFQASMGLGPLRAGGRVVTDFKSRWGPGPGATTFPVNGMTLSFPLTSRSQAFALVHRQPAARQPVPAVLSGAIAVGAHVGSVVPLKLSSGQIVRVRVVASAKNIPTVPDGRDAVLVDTGRLFAVVNLADPGGVVPTEMWLRLKPGVRAAPVRAALARTPFRQVSVTTRAERAAARRHDPLAVATRNVLTALGLIALALAGAALVLSVATGLRDEQGELAELEALGVRAAALRRQVHAGAVFLAVVGAIGAAAGGAALLRIVLRLVHLSGDGRSPLPSLLPAAPWVLLLAATGVAVGAAFALVVGLTGRAMGGDEVGRPR